MKGWKRDDKNERLYGKEKGKKEGKKEGKA
jgi:hypothetical protein